MMASISKSYVGMFLEMRSIRCWKTSSKSQRFEYLAATLRKKCLAPWILVTLTQKNILGFFVWSIEMQLVGVVSSNLGSHWNLPQVGWHGQHAFKCWFLVKNSKQYLKPPPKYFILYTQTIWYKQRQRPFNEKLK